MQKVNFFCFFSTNFLVLQYQIYIFGYKTTVFIQNLYILVKSFGKNAIYRVKSTIFFGFSGPNLHFWIQNYSFYPKFAHFSEIFLGKNFIFRVKSTNFLVLQYQIYIFGYKTTVFIQNLYILVKFFGKNFIFNAKSKFFLFFQDQMYIFGYKATVFIQNLYILVKFFGKNFIFRVKSTNFLFFGTKCTFLGTKLQFLSKICTF